MRRLLSLAIFLLFAGCSPNFFKTKTIQDIAMEGDVESQYKLGMKYLHGNGISRNIEEGARWLTFAAENGKAEALFELGYIYEGGMYEGYGITADYPKSVHYYERSVKEGDRIAMHNLGLLYEKGNGVKRNYKKACDLYEQSARECYPGGAYQYAWCIYSGKGRSKNIGEAYRWAELASNLANNHSDDTDERVKLVEFVSGLSLQLKSEWRKYAHRPPVLCNEEGNPIK